MRAIDLYSGIGGWTLGLKMAGIDVVASYEWWDKANKTHNINFGTDNPEKNIRKLDPNTLPKGVDIVVGSPPCTQFSYANRGGSGDIEDGLVDISKFLSIIRHVKPRNWAMENVPRVAKILEREIKSGGSLHEFADLIKVITVIDMSDYGLPQRRKRAIVGDFPIDLLEGYREVVRTRTLGEVLTNLHKTRPRDPIYGFPIKRLELTDNLHEDFLNEEELRMNWEAKRYHPVYNKMEFPDALERPARTVTATCTRVSRESIVIPDIDDPSRVRRLTVRERASLQGFPLTFQFMGDRYTEKIKMVGNAIPPVFTYYLGLAMRNIELQEALPPDKIDYKHNMPSVRAKETRPDKPGNKYPPKRKFRVALPWLRFGSGMRFELANHWNDNGIDWTVSFYYGTSKDIRTINLDDHLFEEIRNTKTYLDSGKKLKKELDSLKKNINVTDAKMLQKAWTHELDSTGPYQIVDQLGEVVSKTKNLISLNHQDEIRDYILKKTVEDKSHRNGKYNGRAKIVENATLIYVGLLIGSWFNATTMENWSKFKMEVSDADS